jgi:hypothetical protein
MDCRTFRKQHVAFVDDTLPGIVQVQMERHLIGCLACAKLDADVRRGLLLFRNNLPTIEPSADFSRRLEARLEQERRRAIAPAPLFRGPGLGGFLAMSASVVAAGLLAMTFAHVPPDRRVARLPAVVLRPLEVPEVPAGVTLPVAPSAVVASVSTGMAVWPALLLLEEAPSRYVDDRETSTTPAVRAVNYSPGREAR